MPPALQQSHVTDAVLTLTNRVGVVTSAMKPLRASFAADLDTIRTATSKDAKHGALEHIQKETLPKMEELLNMLDAEVGNAQTYFRQLPNGPGLLNPIEEVESVRVPKEQFDELQTNLDHLGQGDELDKGEETRKTSDEGDEPAPAKKKHVH